MITSWGEELPTYDDYLHKNVQYAKDGDVKQFEEVQKRKTELKIFPNPAEEQITVELPFYINKDVDITLYNNLGMAVLSLHHSNGDYAEFDIRSLQAGFYVVRCVKNDKGYF